MFAITWFLTSKRFRIAAVYSGFGENTCQDLRPPRHPRKWMRQIGSLNECHRPSE
ncbi:hypothetical protein J6590_005105 [Homalodisca vitripennis]|nr:hypothetical protein J6590_005105 [Homalodisca vitripennis]